MKFQLSIKLERRNAGECMKDIMDHTLEMVQMADRGGFHIVWSAEHHALEVFGNLRQHFYPCKGVKRFVRSEEPGLWGIDGGAVQEKRLVVM